MSFVLVTVAAGITLETNLTINWSISSSPSFLRKVLVTLTTTANIGINASKVAYASADARTGHRFREKLRETIIQKCANLCSFESGVYKPSARSIHKPIASSRSFFHLENLPAISRQDNW